MPKPLAPRVKDMHQHVMDVCDDQEIIHKWCRFPYQAWSDSKLAVVGIPRIKSPAAYATALHEIGHILGRHQKSRDLMLRERGAWQWARLNALVWTPDMEHYALRCLGFVAEASRRARKQVPEWFR